MEAKKLYAILEKDFIKPKLSDDWVKHMGEVKDFLSPNFKKRDMGLVCDFAKEINKVYTAVFPSDEVMQRILRDKIQDAMLFVHHPATWNIRKAPTTWQQMNRQLLQQFKEKKISIYNLHVPLDNYGDYSTGVSLAKVLSIKPKKPFAPYFGSLCGVFGRTQFDLVEDLKEKFEEAVNHKVKLYAYGDDKIRNKEVAVVAGGGDDLEILQEILKAGINTFITGLSIKNDYSKKAHEFAEKNKINILGGTHYSTEKFACISLVDYFKKLGLESEFIPDAPVLEDM